jgi:hypothetical protein
MTDKLTELEFLRFQKKNLEGSIFVLEQISNSPFSAGFLYEELKVINSDLKRLEIESNRKK